MIANLDQETFSEKHNMIQNPSTEISTDSKINSSKKIHKTFKIKKEKRNLIKLIHESDFDLNIDENGTNKVKNLIFDEIGISNSKLNFKELNESDKDSRLRNLGILVKSLKTKIKKIEDKIKSNRFCPLKKYINYEISKKSKDNNMEECDFSIQNLQKALLNLQKSQKIEMNEDKELVINLINLIAENKINFDSIHFRKLCTQIRMFLPEDKIKYCKKFGKKTKFSFPKKSIYVTSIESAFYKKFKKNEEIMKKILGVDTYSCSEINPLNLQKNLGEVISTLLSNRNFIANNCKPEDIFEMVRMIASNKYVI